ncbi:histidine kinase [Micrococcales bacterium 31B]|nr:histidine kinase [Micrococcales bacterium 31B]
MPWTNLVIALLAVGIVAGAFLIHRAARSRHVLGSEADRAIQRALHIVSEAAPLLRGDVAETGDHAARHLSSITGVPTVALASASSLLGWDGPGKSDLGTLASGLARDIALDGDKGPGCKVHLWAGRDLQRRGAKTARMHAMGVLLDLVPGDQPQRCLLAFTPWPPTSRDVLAMQETARFVSSQFELAALDAAQAALARAEVVALRAQISPHFIYNALNAIASYTRTDPEHARELLLDFADFTRYSFRKRDHATTLAEELTAVEQYLSLEQARFGERLRVRLDIAPETLTVQLPYLCLQPLVENAVKHGIEKRAGEGRINIVARSVGPDVLLSIEDDGVGMDPRFAAEALAGRVGHSIGIANVDQRLIAAFGHGLDVETAPGAGTKVGLRIPKFAMMNL